MTSATIDNGAEVNISQSVNRFSFFKKLCHLGEGHFCEVNCSEYVLVENQNINIHHHLGANMKGGGFLITGTSCISGDESSSKDLLVALTDYGLVVEHLPVV